MDFQRIDMDKWNRKECFNHYFNNAKCSYSITVNMDISNLMDYIKSKNLRFYPTFTWMVAKAINNHEEFRMGFDEEGNIGFFDEIGPCYSVLSDETKVMSDLFTEYDAEFKKFYKDMEISLDRYKRDNSFRTNFQNNFFIVSCLPWIEYTAFNVNNEGSRPFLFPMVTWGKFFSQDDKTLIPLTIQVHHAVADGYHCSLFFLDINEMVTNPEKYLES